MKMLINIPAVHEEYVTVCVQSSTTLFIKGLNTGLYMLIILNPFYATLT